MVWKVLHQLCGLEEGGEGELCRILMGLDQKKNVKLSVLEMEKVTVQEKTTVQTEIENCINYNNIEHKLPNEDNVKLNLNQETEKDFTWESESKLIIKATLDSLDVRIKELNEKLKPKIGPRKKKSDENGSKEERGRSWRRAIKYPLSDEIKSAEDIGLICYTKDPSPERPRSFFLAAESRQDSPPFSCKECKYSVISFSRLKIHFYGRHFKGEKRYKCKECDEKFYYSQKVWTHWKVIHRPQDFLKHVCNICNKRFLQLKLLEKHSESHSDILHPCSFCGKVFNTNFGRIGHEKLHTAKEVICTDCGKIFSNKYNHQLHFRVVHLKKIKTEECEHCGKMINVRSVTKHRQTHDKERKKSYVCTWCGSSFWEEQGLKHHIQTVHTKENRFQCPFCEKFLSSKEKFKLHSKRMHGGRQLEKQPSRIDYKAVEKFVI